MEQLLLQHQPVTKVSELSLGRKAWEGEEGRDLSG